MACSTRRLKKRASRGSAFIQLTNVSCAIPHSSLTREQDPWSKVERYWRVQHKCDVGSYWICICMIGGKPTKLRAAFDAQMKN